MIPVSVPVIAKNAQKYILDCLKTGWISSSGKYIQFFEQAFADYLGVKYATTVSSGTAALHLALAALGIGKGDEVIVPDLTIISCSLAAVYTGATPVLADVDPITGNLDPESLLTKITKKTKAIMVVHLWGHPADMDPIIKLAKKYNLMIIEDACQAHGAEYQGKKAGSFGMVSCFSFYGNKIITCGEGGMVVTSNKRIYQKLKLLKDLAHSKNRRFLHKEIGFNYRMTNLQAALGLAQLEEVEKYLKKKLWMANKYSQSLQDVAGIELPQTQPWAKNVFWMYTLKVKKGSLISRDKICQRLRKLGVDTRDFFIPLHKQPVLRQFGPFKDQDYPVSSDLSLRGFYLPSGLALTSEQIDKVVKAVKKVML